MNSIEEHNWIFFLLEHAISGKFSLRWGYALIAPFPTSIADRNSIAERKEAGNV